MKNIIIRCLLLAIFNAIGYFLYKNLVCDDIWKYTFSFIYGEICMSVYLITSDDFN